MKAPEAAPFPGRSDKGCHPQWHHQTFPHFAGGLSPVPAYQGCCAPPQDISSVQVVDGSGSGSLLDDRFSFCLKDCFLSWQYLSFLTSLQRIAIARAVYSDADNLLLDDPLSALDAKVAQEVFTNAVTGECAHRCVRSSPVELSALTKLLAVES